MLSSTGRMSRAAFLACAAVLLGLAAAYEQGLARGLGVRLGWIVYPLLLFPTACILSKRLHDRGHAGWWGFLVVWALVEGWIGINAWPAPMTPVGSVALLVADLAALYLGLMPGQRGPNRFGSNPAETRSPRA